MSPFSESEIEAVCSFETTNIKIMIVNKYGVASVYICPLKHNGYYIYFTCLNGRKLCIFFSSQNVFVGFV
jgi:hypothetical protein